MKAMESFRSKRVRFGLVRKVKAPGAVEKLKGPSFLICHYRIFNAFNTYSPPTPLDISPGRK